MQNSPLESSCVIVALIESYSTSKLLNISPEKSQILSYDTLVPKWAIFHLNRNSFLRRLDAPNLTIICINSITYCLNLMGLCASCSICDADRRYNTWVEFCSMGNRVKLGKWIQGYSITVCQPFILSKLHHCLIAESTTVTYCLKSNNHSNSVVIAWR